MAHWMPSDKVCVYLYESKSRGRDPEFLYSLSILAPGSQPNSSHSWWPEQSFGSLAYSPPTTFILPHFHHPQQASQPELCTTSKFTPFPQKIYFKQLSLSLSFYISAHLFQNPPCHTFHPCRPRSLGHTPPRVHQSPIGLRVPDPLYDCYLENTATPPSLCSFILLRWLKSPNSLNNAEEKSKSFIYNSGPGPSRGCPTIQGFFG